MGEHGVFLRVKSDRIVREIEAHFFAVDFHLRLRERGFEAIRGAFVVRAENNGVSAFHFQSDFVVVFANLGKFLAHGWLDRLIEATGFCRHDLWVDAELIVVNIERERTILKQSTALQEHVIPEMLRGADSDFDPVIRGAQVEARWSRRRNNSSS